MTFYDLWRELAEQAWGPHWTRKTYQATDHMHGVFDPEADGFGGREAFRMGADAIEAYVNARDYVDDGAGVFNQDAEDAIQAAAEFFASAWDSIVLASLDPGLT